MAAPLKQLLCPFFGASDDLPQCDSLFCAMATLQLMQEYLPSLVPSAGAVCAAERNVQWCWVNAVWVSGNALPVCVCALASIPMRTLATW